MAFNFMATEILEPKKIKCVTVSTFSVSTCHEVMGLAAMISVFFVVVVVTFQANFFTLLFHPHQEAL